MTRDEMPIETEIYGVLYRLGIETDHATAQAFAGWIADRESTVRAERDALAAENAQCKANWKCLTDWLVSEEDGCDDDASWEGAFDRVLYAMAAIELTLPPDAIHDPDALERIEAHLARAAAPSPAPVTPEDSPA